MSTTNSGNANVTPEPSIHDLPAVVGQGLKIAGQLESSAQFIIEGFIGQVLIAFGGISIEGVKPFALLAALGQALVQQANDAYTQSLTAQSTADSATTTADTALGNWSALLDAIPGVSTVEEFADAFTGGITDIPAKIEAAVGELADELFNGLTGSGASGVGLGLIGQEISKLKNLVDTANDLATQAFNVTTQFGGALHQLVDDLEESPVYVGFEDFLEQIGNVLNTVVTNIVQSLSPSNPGTATNSNQIAALWAHVSEANTAGIHYSFNPSVALTANYAGTSNPAWGAAGPLTMPSVFPNSNYVYSTSGTQGMVFLGNPNAATNGDHGLVTDKNQAYTTVASLAFGTDVIFMSGHYSGGTLGQNVELELGYGGPSALALYTCTGANSGRTRQTLTMADGVTTNTQYDIPNGGVKLNDVWGMQFDGVRTYTIYYNNTAVATWQDNPTTPILTHGPGYRECGVIPTNTGGSFIGMSEFTALDYV